MTSKSVFVLLVLFVSYSNCAYNLNGLDWLFGFDDNFNSFADFNPDSDEDGGDTFLL